MCVCLSHPRKPTPSSPPPSLRGCALLFPAQPSFSSLSGWGSEPLILIRRGGGQDGGIHALRRGFIGAFIYVLLLWFSPPPSLHQPPFRLDLRPVSELLVLQLRMKGRARQPAPPRRLLRLSKGSAEEKPRNGGEKRKTKTKRRTNKANTSKEHSSSDSTVITTARQLAHGMKSSSGRHFYPPSLLLPPPPPPKKT